ncbi:MAG TPA: mechanosensitive ion channel family protein [Thermoanaerobaculia bacterium]|nr:mechanosensitive ion channel family protein [Thermoanaerobaculia bacterium]
MISQLALALEWGRAPILGNRPADWAVAVAVALAAALVLVIVKRLLLRRFGGRLEARAAQPPRGPAELDELVVELARHSRWLLLAFVPLYLGALALDLTARQRDLLRTATVLALLLQTATWASVGIERWVLRERRRRLASDAASATVLGALDFILRLALWVIIILLALDNLGINVTALVAGLGVGGIAIALAMQNILGDILGSLSIAIDKPFVLGDTIQIDDFIGQVEDVGLKTTRLRSLSGEQLIFANGDLLKSRIRNHQRMRQRRVVLAFGLDFRTTADQVERVPGMVRRIVESRNGVSGVRFDRAHFKGFGKTALDFEAIYYLPTSDYGAYMDEQQAINLALMRALASAGIVFALPDPAAWGAVDRPPPGSHAASPTTAAQPAPAGSPAPR